MTVLEKYKLTFTTYTRPKEFEERPLLKSPTVELAGTIGRFCNGITDFDFLEKVINKTQLVLADELTDYHTGLEEIDIFIEKNETEFVPFIGEATDFNKPEYIMPTADFRDILVEWKKYVKNFKYIY